MLGLLLTGSSGLLILVLGKKPSNNERIRAISFYRYRIDIAQIEIAISPIL